MDNNICWLVGLPLWSRLKYLNSENDWLQWNVVQIFMVPRGWSLTLLIMWCHDEVDSVDILWNVLDYCMASMKCSTDIIGAQRIPPDNTGDPLTFNEAPSSGQSLNDLHIQGRHFIRLLFLMYCQDHSATQFPVGLKSIILLPSLSILKHPLCEVEFKSPGSQYACAYCMSVFMYVFNSKNKNKQE